MRRSERDHVHNRDSPGRALRRSDGLGDMEDNKMSDILIKNMEMPKDCYGCQFLDAETMFCNLTGERVTHDEGQFQRMDFCPLVEVKLHGRLIDADRLANEIGALEYKGQYVNEGMYDFGIADAWKLTVNAPTVLEAST